MVNNNTDNSYKLNINGKTQIKNSKSYYAPTGPIYLKGPAIKINSRTPFYKRIWYMVTNPITYLFNGTRRW